MGNTKGTRRRFGAVRQLQSGGGMPGRRGQLRRSLSNGVNVPAWALWLPTVRAIPRRKGSHRC